MGGPTRETRSGKGGLNGFPAVIVTLHDVMPETMGEVKTWLDYLKKRDVLQVSLLVVPGRSWQPGQLDQLRAWSEAGYPLIAHGWKHETRRIRNLYHGLHALLISRRVAEHLGEAPEKLPSLIKRSLEWFEDQGFPRPTSYVPPAWALGRIPVTTLKSLGLTSVEVLSGIYSVNTGKLRRLPLVGFEADTWPRAIFLAGWNQLMMRYAIRRQMPLRISLHPYDLNLKLRKQIDDTFALDWAYQNFNNLRLEN